MTARYASQQHSVAEEKNIMKIMEIIQYMLKNKNILVDITGEAVSCVVYLINRPSTKSFQNNTPNATWNGVKQNVNHLKIFCCFANSQG